MLMGDTSLWPLISARSGHIDRLRRLNLPDPGKIAEVLEAHENILSAISDGDLGAVDESVREHLSGTLARVSTIKGSYPEYFREEVPNEAE
jgi:DNA-binding GntR family transcriptional regulator